MILRWMVIVIGVISYGCSPDVPESCSLVCKRAYDCGVLDSWLGDRERDCAARCAANVRSEDPDLTTIHDRVVECAQLDTEEDGPGWCADGAFAGCDVFVRCLEEKVPVFEKGEVLVEGGHVFTTWVDLELSVAELTNGAEPTRLDRSDLSAPLDCSPAYCDPYYQDDWQCEPKPGGTMPRFSFASFCSAFEVDTITLGLASPTCDADGCELTPIAEAEPVACMNLWGFDLELSNFFENVRVGPIVPYASFTSSSQSSPMDDCLRIVGGSTVVGSSRLSQLILQLPSPDEIADIPGLAFECD